MRKIEIDKKTWRGLCNLMKMTGRSERSIVKTALRTYIEDTADVLSAERAEKESRGKSLYVQRGLEIVRER